jgi:hypothetical protein
MILWTQQFFQNVQEGGRVAGANSVQSEYGATVFVCLGGWAIHSLGNKKVRTHRKPLCVCVSCSDRSEETQSSRSLLFYAGISIVSCV